MQFGKKDEDAEGRHLMFDRTQVLQETRIFNETPLNSRKSRTLIGKVLVLLYTGEILSRKEATNLFFSITKLFQHKDPALRQIIYLAIKELADKADDILMVTSSLTKDINAKPEEVMQSNNLLANAAASFGFRFGFPTSSGPSSPPGPMGAGGGPNSLIGSNVCHRANAIRALCRVTDPSMLAAIERYLKQAIVDKNAAVSSAAIVSAYHLFNPARDIVRRWANEVQEAFSSNKVVSASPTTGYIGNAYVVQYHALGLLYLIRQNDRMAVAKLVQSLAKSGTVRSQWAQCMLIRFAVKSCQDEAASYGDKNMVSVEGSLSAMMYEYLRSLCNSNDMVMLEAARGITTMVTTDATSLNASQVQPAVTALQQLLSSPKPSLKFAALRTLNGLAQLNPSLVSPCNLDMEQLVSDPNRSIATYAITTLLKTGTETSVDRLMKQITTFMNEISDEFKVIVVDAIRVLAVKFPAKQSVMLNFLSSVLREEGGYEYKKSVVEAIFDLVKSMPDCLEVALAHLCEFIEDCEFTKLAVRILYLLGIEGPKTQNPAKYIRYIYNRVILENSNVRAAAVTALANFGASISSVHSTVQVLLRRCMDDPDDEVRDRAILYLQILEDKHLQKQYLNNDSLPALPILESKLQHYNAAADYSKALDLTSVPQVSKAELLQERNRASSPVRAMSSPVAMATGRAQLPPPILQPTAHLEKISELAPLMPTLLKSNKSTDLTEKEMEYLVRVNKHIFAEWIVFEFTCVNTIEDSLLENVTVQMRPDEPTDHLMRQMLVVPAAKMIRGQENKIFIGFQKPSGSAPTVSFTTSLKYVIKDCDPVTFEPDSAEGYDDEYALEAVDLTIADYMLPSAVSEFQSAWDALDADSEQVETLQLSMPGIVAAIKSIVDLLGMQPLEGSGVVAKDKNSHQLLLAGVFIGGARVCARVRMAYDVSSQAVAMQFAVRSDSVDVVQLVINAVQE